MKLMEIFGNVAAVFGILVCCVAGVSRLLGNWQTLGFSTMTLFTLGVGLMVVACLAKLQVLNAR
jgi:hypothetical protein